MLKHLAPVESETLKLDHVRQCPKEWNDWLDENPELIEKMNLKKYEI